MRTTTLLVLTLMACGRDPNVAVVDAQHHTTSGLENGAAADAILGQLTERGMSAARADAGSFGSVNGVAIGLANDQLWVADGANKRVLGFADADTASIANGAEAGVVLNQRDFATSDFRNIPTAQKIRPTGVAVDLEERVYAFDDTNVLVFENPFVHDTVPDYELAGEPVGIRSVRSLTNSKLAVVGANQLVFYERGSPDAYAQATITAPCLDSAYDITEAGGIFFVVCSAGLACSDPKVPPTCSGVVVYEIDSVTGFAALGDPSGLPEPYVAYTELLGARSVQFEPNRLLIAETDGHRITRYENPVTQALAVIGGTGTAHTPTNAAANPYGQPDTTTAPVPNYYNAGLPRVSDQGLYLPTVIAVSPMDRVMWVADQNNHRVVVYPDVAASSPTVIADIVLGQPDPSHAFANRLEANSFGQVAGVAIGPGPGGQARAAVVDTAGNRVLLYDSISAYTTGDDPLSVLGQSSTIDFDVDGSPPTPTGLNSPTHAAIGATGGVWVTDTGNNRVVVYENTTTAAQVFGATNLTSFGVYSGLGAVAVDGSNVFVAAGNRVFVYTAQTRKPTLVLGQEQPLPSSDLIGNLANRGGSARADSLFNVTGLAVDASGRLWVADTGNHRVLWFDDPTSTTNITDTVTADGVVGQPDFSSSTSRMASGAVNRYSFAGISGVAISEDGTLWVSDNVDSRVLAFFNPTEADPILGVPRADLVLGQERFSASGINNTPNGIDAHTLNAPFAIACDSTGRVLLVSDRGNNRAVRYIRNQPPKIAGDGVHDIVRGESMVVTVTVTDPENDTVDIGTVDPYVVGVSGAPPLSVPVTLDWALLPEEPPIGSDIVVNVVATDQGDRPQQTTFSVVFHIIERSGEPATGTPPGPLPAISPETGCACAGGATVVPWLVAVFALRRRRRG